jgi:hypothetical protein
MLIKPTDFVNSGNINREKLEYSNYKYTNSLDLLLICIALGEQNKYIVAIELFEKFKSRVLNSNNIIFGLTTIIAICLENSDVNLANTYSKELEIIEN